MSTEKASFPTFQLFLSFLFFPSVRPDTSSPSRDRQDMYSRSVSPDVTCSSKGVVLGSFDTSRSQDPLVRTWTRCPDPGPPACSESALRTYFRFRDLRIPFRPILRINGNGIQCKYLHMHHDRWTVLVTVPQELLSSC